MSIDRDKLIKLKIEIEKEGKQKTNNVRMRSDVYELVKNHVEKESESITKFVTIATIEKLIKDAS